MYLHIVGYLQVCTNHKRENLLLESPSRNFAHLNSRFYHWIGQRDRATTLSSTQ